MKNENAITPNDNLEFSNNYKKFAEDVLKDVSKNKILAEYYNENTQKDIRNCKRMINSIKKQAGKGCIPNAIEVFEERIKDASLLLKQINEGNIIL